MGRSEQRTRRGSWLIRGIIAVPLSVLTTIALAWGIVWFSEPVMRPFDAQVLLHQSRPSWSCTIWEFRGRISVNYRPVFEGENVISFPPSFTTDMDEYPKTQERMLKRVQHSWWTFSGPPDPATADEYHGWSNETAIGWPMWAMKHGSLMDGRQRNPQTGFLQARFWAWELEYGGRKRVLPLKPIWSGFLINTLFALLIWLLLFGAALDGYRAIRRWIRRRRSQCETCGYDRRATAPERPCPECGMCRSEHDGFARKKPHFSLAVAPFCTCKVPDDFFQRAERAQRNVQCGLSGA